MKTSLLVLLMLISAPALARGSHGSGIHNSGYAHNGYKANAYSSANEFKTKTDQQYYRSLIRQGSANPRDAAMTVPEFNKLADSGKL